MMSETEVIQIVVGYFFHLKLCSSDMLPFKTITLQMQENHTTFIPQPHLSSCEKFKQYF